MEGISVGIIHHVLLEHISKTLHPPVVAKFLQVSGDT